MKALTHSVIALPSAPLTLDEMEQLIDAAIAVIDDALALATTEDERWNG
jgi:hypothetical protein